MRRLSFAELNYATIRVLQANGCEVVVPLGHSCGALAVHAGGAVSHAILLAQTWRHSSPSLLTPSSRMPPAAAAKLKEYAQLFPAGAPEQAQAETFQNKMKDVTEFLAAIGLTSPLQRLPLRVTYQDSCHLLHGQKIAEAPRKLLRAIPGVELIEMPLSDQCCGSAGVYNVTETKASLDLLEIKTRYEKSRMPGDRHRKSGPHAPTSCWRRHTRHGATSLPCDRAPRSRHSFGMIVFTSVWDNAIG